LGLLLAHLVLPILSLQLEVSLTRRASAIQGIREQMEAHVHSVLLAHTKMDLGLVFAYLVWPIPSLQLEVSLTQRASVTQGTQGQMEALVHIVLLAPTR